MGDKLFRRIPDPDGKWELRFWSYVERGDGCWRWKGGGEYGVFSIQGALYLAHRVAYRLATGRPVMGLVCHKCDNPHCVNPEHLYLGDKRTNLLDAIERGQRRYDTQAKGEAHGGAKLNRGQVVEIRGRIASGGETYEQIGATYGVSKATVGHIATGRKWGWLGAGECPVCREGK